MEIKDILKKIQSHQGWMTEENFINEIGELSILTDLIKKGLVEQNKHKRIKLSIKGEKMIKAPRKRKKIAETS